MATKKKEQAITISPPNFQTVEFGIIGTAPYVQNKFSKREMDKMREKQESGSTAKKGSKRQAKDFEQCYQEAIHKSVDGWCGIPAPAFRNAMIDACRMAGFQMTRAKMSVFVEADGFDPDDGTPLVRFETGEPKRFDSVVRISMGSTDIRPRPIWEPGWKLNLRVHFDADQFTKEDVANLLLRAGEQVGVGEGRPFSKTSNGQGWGTFAFSN